MIKKISIFLVLCLSVYIINGCQLVNVTPGTRVNIYIKDIDRGVIASYSTVNVLGVTLSSSTSVNYISGQISDSTLYLSTTDNFEQYEENETSQELTIQAVFQCPSGATSTQFFVVTIEDTNNNSPVFLPLDENNEHQGYDFYIVPPLGVGFEITGCHNTIAVRDIDLTTRRIHFGLTGSEDFEIIYDEASSTEPKQFMAILRTTTIIRSLPTALELVISATDVDDTGDPPRTTYTTVRLTAENGTQLPDEPVFDQALYTATYTRDNTLILEGSISLRQGYHAEVSFELDQEYSDYFTLITNEKEVSIAVTTPLSEDIMTRQHIFLIIRAERELTSGATTTVVVELPEDIILQFEQTDYQGTIKDNELILSDLILTQGYENHIVTVSLSNGFFTATVVENVITLSMQPLPENIIEDNTFLNIAVNASTPRSSAIVIVTLEIIKNDTVTPVFAKVLYEGRYDTDIGLDIEQIELTQGFDNTVEINLIGDYASLFNLTRNEHIFTITVDSLPPEVMTEQSLILSIEATKPRTVGATAAITIALPKEIALEFESTLYEGAIVDNTLLISDLILSQGYDGHIVSATTTNEYFTASVAGNRLTLLMGSLPESTIANNSFLNFEVIASIERSSASTVVTLQIVKNDTVTPVFAQVLYEGTYDSDIGLDIEDIELIQGYDDTVDIDLKGDHAQLFTLIRNDHISTVTVGTLPPEIIAEQTLTLTIEATKPRTVGATAAITIALPKEIALEFESTLYEGAIVDNTLLISDLILSQGYDGHIVSATTTNEYFTASVAGNRLTLLMGSLPESTIANNSFLNFEVIASTERNSASAVVTLQIVKNDTVTPVFAQVLYEGTYDSDIGLDIEDIELIQGYDDTVDIDLKGDHAQLFTLIRNDHISTVTVGTLPPEIIAEQTLTLTIEATKPRTVGATAAITIAFPKEISLEFERTHYEGAIVDNTLQLSDLILSQGYDGHTVSVTTSNVLFTASVTGDRITLVMESLPEEIIENNSFLNVEVIASTERSSASAVVILEIVKNDTVTPVFENVLYEGTFDIELGLNIQEIKLIQGFDVTVEIDLRGEHAELFTLNRNEHIFILTVDSLPPDVIAQQSLMLTIEATKPRTVGASAVIAIALPRARELEFDSPSYSGTYQNSSLTVDAIELNIEDNENVNFTITGDYATYFEASNSGSQVTITLLNELPDNVISQNNFLLLTLSASGINGIANAVLFIEIIKVDAIIPIFSENIYHGTYSDGSIDISDIILVQGFDGTVSLKLEGEHSRYFTHTDIPNGISLTLNGLIPDDVIFNEKALIFSVLAEKPFTVGAHATISITFPSELTDLAVMKFSRNTYVGSLDNGVFNLADIVLDVGYVTGTEFVLTGDYANYFTHANINNVVTISTFNTLPTEIIRDNKFLILELEARRERAVSVFSSIIIDLEQEENNVILPVFNKAYYRGSYDKESGLQFEDEIFLSQGNDGTVEFYLTGEFSEHFNINNDNNVIILSPNIPEEVWENNEQLIFTIVASKPDIIKEQAAIVIDFVKESSNAEVLGFEKTSYVGVIENKTANLEQITLTYGYRPEVNFTLHGDLEFYFNLTIQDATVILQLQNAIPEELIPTNRIIILEIRATIEDSLPAVATIVLEVVLEDSSPSVQLVFNETYYVGTYTVNEGVTLQNLISLSDGYDEYVVFELEEDDSGYFEIVQNGNSVSLITPIPIPSAVLTNNNQLLFIIKAQRPNAATVRATVVIHLPNEFSQDAILGFEKTSYLGVLVNETVNIEQITLREGYTSGVLFAVHGELESFFTVSALDATVTLQLQNTIPEELIPTNRIIILEIRATIEDSMPAVATIVLEVVLEDSSPSVQLVFNETYYVGTYTVNEGVTLPNLISLSDGYDEYVVFELEEDDSRYFEIVQNGNSVSLITPIPIPSAVLANNNQLLFIIKAQRPNAATVRATVVIHLPNEFSQDAILGFEKTSYLGVLVNETVNIEQITLREGYTSGVLFAVHGELESFFTVSALDATVTLQLQNTIPEELIPMNRIIILEIRATIEDSMPAVATIVLEVVLEDSSPSVQLVFNETYYVGTYTVNEGVTLQNLISLSDGYDEYVVFELEEDDSRYFEIVQNGNSVSLITPIPIPSAVLANNNQLLFIIKAQRPNAATVRATVVIHLPNEFSQDAILGFEKTSYLGVLVNETVNIEQITLREGYTSGVLFAVHGELESFFTVSALDATVTLQLQNTIPEELIPTNRIIILEIRATIEDSMPAVATIVLEVVLEDSSPSVQLVFNETYYVGTYTVNEGVTLQNLISLSDGYDEYVVFELEEDDSGYFEIVQNGNSVSLITPIPIPSAVLANNNQLLFIIKAQRPKAATVRATVVIHLPNEFSQDAILGFEKTSYLGVLVNETVNIEQITLREGYTSGVLFAVHGELESFFTVSALDATVTLQLQNTIPEELIPTNRIIILEIRATIEDSMPAVATIVLEVVLEDSSPSVQLVFNETYYVGTYTVNEGVTLQNLISLSDGYDEYVVFELEEDDSGYFEIVQNGNSVSLITPIPIPSAVLANNNQLLFIIKAQRPNAATVRATVVIHLPNEFSQDAILGFEKTSYLGVLVNETVNIEQITLREGYTSGVLFAVHGELESFFTVSALDATVTLQLQNTIPEELIPTNRIIILEIRATIEDSMPAVATIVLEVVLQDSSPSVQLVFNETYYVGTYTVNEGVTLQNLISLSDGYDEYVVFELEEDDSGYFEIVQNGNSVSLITPIPIPSAVLANNNQLLFIIKAQRPNAATVRATVVIHLPNEFSQDAILGFEKTSYLGVLVNETVNIEQITLREGYTSGVLFAVHGELESFFTVSALDATVTLQLQNTIPEELIPTNRIIILEIRATIEDSMPAVATIVLEVVLEDSSPSVQLVFNETYYVGTYTVNEGVTLQNLISLSDGYDEYVVFELEEDDSRYFEIVQNGNSVSLLTPIPIPSAVLANNNQLLFIIKAQRPKAATVRATVVIHLPNEFSQDAILGFEKTSYLGVLVNETVNIEQITLREGYTSGVLFAVHGELESFFTVSALDATVTLQLQNTIPEELIPTNRIIILEIRATIEDSMPAVATIVLEVVLEDSSPSVQLVFNETYYVGTYTVNEGVTLQNLISLSDGYDEYVVFELEEDDSGYFEIVQNGNSVSLITPIPIPSAVLANNNQLLFIIKAQRPNAATVRATVVIHLPNEFSQDAILGFEKTSYLGVLVNETVNIEQITLREGYTSGVLFAVHGELESFFTVSALDATVTLQLQNTIPEELIPTNRIIILEIRATIEDSLPAVATIVLEVILEDSSPSVQLVFNETYYVGTYTVNEGVTLQNLISLSDGYDEYVVFELEEDDSRYFEIVQNGNSVSLITPIPIPSAVLANNNQLLFIIKAQRPNAATVRATVVIHLPNEFSQDAILGFEKTSYLGVLVNETVNIEQITLREGYTSGVLFAVHGELESFFTVSALDATVTIQLQNTIPEELIPTNRIIILEIRATIEDSMPAVATIVLEVVLEDSSSSVQLVFNETYYVGTYTVNEGVTLPNLISLSDGYDEYVVFELEKDDSRYFEIVQNGNSVSLITPIPIPSAVLANNNQLLFIIKAQRPNAATVRATVVIHLPNEFSQDAILGFEKTSYLGVFVNETVNIEQITLREGYTSGVLFAVHGELESFFTVSALDATVTIQLQNTIPEELIPTNRIIILEIRATIEDSMPAVATIVLEVVLEDYSPSVQLVFNETYYVGTYTVNKGVTLQNLISLSDGYDEYVVFELEEDDSRYFEIVQNGNSVSLITPIPIPSGVLANNNQLLFIIKAQRPNAATVRATVIIYLPNGSETPTVTFNPSAYILRVELFQTGIIGQVYATAANGETVNYSLALEDDHLQTRLTINSDGELYLSSPANSGEYIFQVIATTLSTQATGTAAVYLTVESVDVMLPPLIVLNRDEEEPHENLIDFTNTEYADCTYTLTNGWPVNQNWLYVDSNGLHARSIDREDPSIAFMALSQVQVELVFHCNTGTRTRRSTESETRSEWLGPYDYGTNTWVLADSISYNSTRSFVNLIVNDINDNPPIFKGKENEPIVVGYPITELKEMVLPRALVELQARDADIGENAVLLYWSSEPSLAVSPSSGSVHVRDNMFLENNQRLTVHATDRNGLGLTGSIDLVVKLLDTSNIAVITVRDAFIENEHNILANLSRVVGYEVKVLRSVVISSQTEEAADAVSRKISERTTSGASLELYVYGLIETEPVAVEQLAEDIANIEISGISIASTVPLEDHLEGRLMRISEGNVGLLVATIVLSVLLFLLIVAIAIWFFLKWRKERNYDEFSDENSLESRNESITQDPKPIQPIPRMNIEEIKRSEKRLQEMIDATFNDAVVVPTTSTKEKPVEELIDIAPPDSSAAIVIQDKLKDADSDPSDIDEFGEVIPTRKKSVVTFNEKVERIIHVEDNQDNASDVNVEVLRL